MSDREAWPEGSVFGVPLPATKTGSSGGGGVPRARISSRIWANPSFIPPSSRSIRRSNWFRCRSSGCAKSFVIVQAEHTSMAKTEWGVELYGDGGSDIFRARIEREHTAFKMGK